MYCLIHLQVRDGALELLGAAQALQPEILLQVQKRVLPVQHQRELMDHDHRGLRRKSRAVLADRYREAVRGILIAEDIGKVPLPALQQQAAQRERVIVFDQRREDVKIADCVLPRVVSELPQGCLIMIYMKEILLMEKKMEMEK